MLAFLDFTEHKSDFWEIAQISELL